MTILLLLMAWLGGSMTSKPVPYSTGASVPRIDVQYNSPQFSVPKIHGRR